MNDICVSLVLQIPESSDNFFTIGSKGLVDSLLGLPGVNELEPSESHEQGFSLVQDGVPVHLHFSSLFTQGLLSLVEVGDDCSHHSYGFVQGAHVIMSRESILLKEIFSNDLSYFQSEFLVFRERIGTYQLYNFVEISLLLQDFLELGPEITELTIKIIKVSIQLSLIITSRDVPIDRREMLPLSQLLV